MNSGNVILLQKTVQYYFIIGIFLSVGLGYETTALVLPNRFSNVSSDVFLYTCHALKSVSSQMMINKPLIFDADRDGRMDIFSADLTGRINGVLNFECIVEECRIERWSVVVPHHGFATTPVMITVDPSGKNLAVFISHQAGIFALDASGRMSARFQIPRLRVSLRSEGKVFSSSTPVLSSLKVGGMNWLFHGDHINSSTEKGVYHLQPHVFADAIHHLIEPQRTAAAKSRLDTRLQLIIPVTFTDIDRLSNVHLTAIVIVSLRALLDGDPRLAVGYRPTAGLQIHMLEVTGNVAVTDNYQPTLLTSPPVVIAAASKKVLDDSNRPGRDEPYITQSLLATTSTGHVHRISIPLVGGDQSHVWDLGRVPLSHSCHPIGCPVSLVSTPAESSLCCLLLDASSQLRLMDLTQPTDEPSPGTETDHAADLMGPARIHWEYKSNTFVFDASEPTGQITLVHGCSSATRSEAVCPLWAVFTTNDGIVHSVDVAYGASAPGYPLRLFPEVSTASQAARGNVTLSAGSGQLTVDADGSPWLVFSDTLGNLYNLDILQATVLPGHVCSHGRATACYPKVSGGVVHVSPSMVPARQVVSDSASSAHSSKPVSLLTWNQAGLQVLVMSGNERTIGSGKRADKNRLLFPTPLVDISLTRLADSNRYDPLQLHYSLPLLGLSTVGSAAGDSRNSDKEALPLASRVRVLDVTGLPLSGWSAPVKDNCTTDSIADRALQHCGHILLPERSGDLTMQALSHILLVVLQGNSDLLWTSGNPLEFQLLLDSTDAGATQYNLRLLILTYLPGIFLLFALSAFHTLSDSWIPGTSWYYYREKSLLRPA